MQTKSIVVLANSVKRSGRCLAGKEVFRAGDGWKIGRWVRPVGTKDGGEIAEYPMSVALGHDPELLEIVEIPFDIAAILPDQPENWLIEKPSKGTWKSLGKLKWRDLPELTDEPQKLWMDPSTNLRRVKEGFPRKMAKPASLYLIKPDKIESVRVWSEHNFSGASYPVKKKRVLTICYAGESHECDIDDPVFSNKYYPTFPTVSQAAMEIKLSRPKDTYVCVSLTGAYYGYHYKIAAAFFEP
jgi:hypothetical protein